MLLTANAVVSFFVAFFWQARVILIIFGFSDHGDAFNPWKAYGNPNSPQSNMRRFIAGEILPDLRRKWLKAIVYVVISYTALFLVTGILSLIAPESLHWG
jgi:hypothetical protein